MALTRKLTWQKARTGYRKIYRGQTHYLRTKCRNKSDEKGYQAALKEWFAVKAHLDGEGPAPYVDGKWDSEAYQARLAQYLLMRSEGQTVEEIPGSVIAFASDYSKLAIKPPQISARKPADITIADLFEEYLSTRRSEVKSKSLSVKQYAQDYAKLKDFEGFAAQFKTAKLREITGELLRLYQQTQKELIVSPDPEQRISAITAKKRLQTVCKVLKWAYAHDYLQDLPRVLSVPGFANVNGINRPSPQFWELAEVRTLFNEASARTKTYICLALNCGYTQREVSTLKWEHVNTDRMIIDRKRPKTGQPQRHSLWPITLKLLQAESKSKTGLCLLTTPHDKLAENSPLLAEVIKADGVVTVTDTIRNAFDRLLKKTELAKTGRSFKSLRKTAAQQLLVKFNDTDLVDRFLAHSSKGEVREHYVDPEAVYAKYDEAITWLAEAFGFDRVDLDCSPNDLKIPEPEPVSS